MVAGAFVFFWLWGRSNRSSSFRLAYLEHSGFEACCRDLNWEFAHQNGFVLSQEMARNACRSRSLGDMNEAYFAIEDVLMDIAARYNGRWNAQSGFKYSDSPQLSSACALAAVERPSPFDLIFGNVINEIQRNPPGIIGFCIAAVQQIVPTLQLCSRLRGCGFDGTIAIGGNTVSRLAREMAIPEMFKLVDALIEFEGERPLVRLSEAVKSGRSLGSVPRLVWCDHGDIRRNEFTEPFDPDEPPAPEYSDLPVGQYWGANFLNVLGSRGCYYGRCNFCAIPYGWGSGGYAGSRSPTRVYRDMLTLMERHGINRFKFVDEALSPRFMQALATLISKDQVKLEWEGYTRLERAWCDPAFVKLIAEAGFRKGYFGLEVVPSDNRRVLNKHDAAEPAELLKLCDRFGVRAHLFCMFGYPGTDGEDANRTVEFVLKNRHLIDTADIFPWTYTKHTNVQRIEILKNPQHNWALEFAHSGSEPGVLSSAEVTELASQYEEILWQEAPDLLHPTYRLVTPWMDAPPSSTKERHPMEM